MKKIPISNFKKKHGEELFSQVSQAVRLSNCDNHVIKNSQVNINKIIQQLPENEIKTKFSRWSSGYDFAVIDIV
jgi:hypothetical protein